jgi:flagellar biosynthesis protein
MEKNKKAIALQYDKKLGSAPKVVAKGKGLVAEKIIETAESHEVPVFVDEKLSNQLMQLQIGQEIPESLYAVVAEVLVFISRIDEAYR